MDLSRLDTLPAILSGDPEAEEFQDGCKLLGYFLFCILRRAGFSPSDSEILSLETVGDVVLRISKFKSRGTGSFAAWCRQFTLNRSKNWIRAETHHGGQTVDPKLIDFFYLDNNEPDCESAISDEASIAWELLSSLDTQCYQVMIMRAVDELSFQEIAENLDIEVANARQLFRRGRLKLARIMRERTAG